MINICPAPVTAGAVDRIRYMAVHEFGHLLGFVHEQDSPAWPVDCASPQPWAGVTQVGARDGSPS